MAKHIEDDITYYYDSHPTEKDLMGEPSVHRSLINYLALVLTWLFHEQACALLLESPSRGYSASLVSTKIP